MKAETKRVLIIDDEQEIRSLLHVALQAHGYECAQAGSGEEGLAEAAAWKPDLVLLDMGLPDMEGLTVVRRLREWSKAPVIILSVRDQEMDKIQALDFGADDYLAKPFSMGELLARIRVALRHQADISAEPVLSFGDLTIDLNGRVVRFRNVDVRLTPTEYDLLKKLALHAGKVVTHRQLLTAVWGRDYEEETHYLRIFIGHLRRKIEPNPTCPAYIITEPGVGYRLQIPKESEEQID